MWPEWPLGWPASECWSPGPRAGRVPPPSGCSRGTEPEWSAATCNLARPRPRPPRSATRGMTCQVMTSTSPIPSLRRHGWRRARNASTDAAVDDLGRTWQLSNALLQRAGTGDDIARLALYLASDESAWVTGQNISIDGGATAGWRDDEETRRIVARYAAS